MAVAESIRKLDAANACSAVASAKEIGKQHAATHAVAELGKDLDCFHPTWADIVTAGQRAYEQLKANTGRIDEDEGGTEWYVGAGGWKLAA